MHVCHRKLRGTQGTFAYLGDFGLVIDPEDAEHGVADELQYLSATGMDRSGDGFEIVVQHRDQEIERDTVRQRCEPAQVAHPQHRTDRLAVAPFDVAGVNPAPGFAAEIQVEHALGHLGARLQFGNDADRRSQGQQAFDFRIRKAALPVGRP